MGLLETKRLIEKAHSEPEVVRAIMALAHSIGFTRTIFVSAAGTNYDGSSWEQAYTSLTTALDWIEANQATGEVHCIILGTGTWDMNLTGVPTYSTNIAIYGIDSRDQAIISNTHATATGVLQFTGWCSINNVYIDCGTGETGINLNGIGANGSRIRKVNINCTALAAGADGILLDGGIEDVIIWNVQINGEAVNTSGIHLNNANHCIIQDIMIHTALVGLQSDHADDDDNEFYECHIHTCATGIQIVNVGATNNHFDQIYLSGNTANIADGGTTTLFTNIHLAVLIASVYPADLTGQLIVAGVGANTWSAAAAQIRSAATATKPFIITGISYECTAAERHGLRLYSDGGTNPIYDDILETGAAVARKTEFSNFSKIWVNQGLAIHGRTKSETGGNNMNVWLKLQVV